MPSTYSFTADYGVARLTLLEACLHAYPASRGVGAAVRCSTWGLRPTVDPVQAEPTEVTTSEAIVRRCDRCCRVALVRITMKVRSWSGQRTAVTQRRLAQREALAGHRLTDAWDRREPRPLESTA